MFFATEKPFFQQLVFKFFQWLKDEIVFVWYSLLCKFITCFKIKFIEYIKKNSQSSNMHTVIELNLKDLFFQNVFSNYVQKTDCSTQHINDIFRQTLFFS